MKRLLVALGAIFGLVLVCAICGIAFLALSARGLSKESQAYVDDAIPAITLHWSRDELENRASPEFSRGINNEDLMKLLSLFHRDLGGLQKYKGATGGAWVVFNRSGKDITADYVASADYERAPATIRIKLIRHGERWQILALHVDSKAFLEH